MQARPRDRFLPAPSLMDEHALPVLDMEVFSALAELLDPTVVAYTYREFLAQTRLRLFSMPKADETRQLHEIAHAMRGTAAMLGANGIAMLVTQLEHDAITTLRLEQVTRQLERSCNRLELALCQARVVL